MYSSGFRYLNIIVTSVAVGIALFVDPLLSVMSDPAFHPAATLVPIIVLAYVFQAWTDVVRFGIDASEKTRYVTYATWGAAIPMVAGYAVLIPAFGSLGAAIATLIGFAVRFGLMLAFAQRVWPVDYRWQSILLLLGWGCALAGTYHLVAPQSLLRQLALAAFLGAVYVIGGLTFAVTPAERGRIWAAVARLPGTVRFAQ
jgi:O-antigen/teichoic acid export membrane protein